MGLHDGNTVPISARSGVMGRGPVLRMRVVCIHVDDNDVGRQKISLSEITPNVPCVSSGACSTRFRARCSSTIQKVAFSADAVDFAGTHRVHGSETSPVPYNRHLPCCTCRFLDDSLSSAALVWSMRRTHA